ncbi:hypothetical protein [Nitrospira sp. BLG_1]
MVGDIVKNKVPPLNQAVRAMLN